VSVAEQLRGEEIRAADLRLPTAGECGETKSTSGASGRRYPVTKPTTCSSRRATTDVAAKSRHQIRYA
jgi:hypothetical protein